MATTFWGVNIQQLRNSISDGLSYWGQAMRGILPASVQQRLTVGEEHLIVRLDDEQMFVEKSINGKLMPVATFAQAGDLLDAEALKTVKKYLNQDNDLILQVADETVLSKPVGFPLAVADNLHQTIGYEMDKHTPFNKEDVLFDIQIENRQENSLQARLYILHRNQVAPILAAFEQAKIRFDRICPRSDSRVNLLPQVQRRKRPILASKRNVLFACVWLVLLALLLVLPLYFKRDVAIKLESQMAVLSKQAMGEGELWEIRDEEERTIMAFIDSYPMPFSQIYEELSKRLPDDTWTNNFKYQNGKIAMSGESKDAAALIELINASSLFKNARIISPIVKSKRAVGKEIFNIAFDVVTTVDGGQGE